MANQQTRPCVSGIPDAPRPGPSGAGGPQSADTHAGLPPDKRPCGRPPRIGALSLESPLILAPMAGITNLPFRLLAREAGCAMVYTEMVSADGIVRRSAETQGYLKTDPAERPLALQLFGSDPLIMAEAAAAVVEACEPDVLDINMGCAVRKIVKIGSGVALMQTPERTAALLRSVRKAVRIPLTIKIRSGWDPSGSQALKIGEMAQDCGVDAVAIHPRTASQKFSGTADWSIIGALKRRLSIPVIGNGDIFSADDVVQMLTQTGCDAVMIGRKSVGYPQIFAEAARRLEGREIPADDLNLRLDLMLRYLGLSVACLGRQRTCRLMRSRLGWFTKGVPDSSGLRQRLSAVTSIDQAQDLIESFRAIRTERGEMRSGLDADHAPGGAGARSR